MMASLSDLAVAYRQDELLPEAADELRRRLELGGAEVDEFVFECFLIDQLTLQLGSARTSQKVLSEIEAGDTYQPVSARRRMREYWSATYEVVSNYWALSLVVSGLFMTILVLSMALIVPDWKEFVPGNEPAARSVEFVAHIADSSGATFDETSVGNFRNRDLFEDDSLVLKAGVVMITYDTGARVVLEGPATYQIQGPNGGNLQLGKLVALVDTADSRGFAVDLPHGRIVDLGTEFGVEVAIDGSAKVAVLTGAVELIGEGSATVPGQRMRLAAGEGASVEGAGGAISQRSEADSRLMATMRFRLPMLRETGPVPATIDIAADFVAFHDFGGEASPGHITTQQSLKETIRLINHTDGLETGITLTIAGANGIGRRSGGETRPPAQGTPADDLFGASDIDLDDGLISVGGNNPSKSMVVTLTGLEPSRRYDIALYGDRNTDADGRERFALEGADFATNASSIGIVNNFNTDLETRPNATCGHLARWIDVVPSADGKVSIKIDTAISSQRNIAYLSGFRIALQENLPTTSSKETN